MESPVERARIELKPIGVFRTERRHTYEAPRQGGLEPSAVCGFIEIDNGYQFEQSIDALRGFSHLWVIFLFHEAVDWKPMVSPPTQTRKVGVFATRSPHRPNHLGLSAVEIVAIEGRRITVRNFDLIDGTPILDIKPYVTAYDSFPEARAGWTGAASYTADDCTVAWSARARAQADWIGHAAGFDLFGTAERNLRHKPFDEKHRRFTRDEAGVTHAFRTWRVRSSWSEGRIDVCEVFSGYSDAELADPEDPYQDKAVHRAFRRHDFGAL